MQDPAKLAREAYNASFTDDKYKAFLKDINPFYDLKKDFRIAETPIFAGKVFKQEAMNLFSDIKTFLERKDYKQLMAKAIPPQFVVANEDAHTSIVCIDFAVTKNEKGEFFPQLIELQGITSLFNYQNHLNSAFRRHFPIPSNFSQYFEGVDDSNYIPILKNVIVGDCDPENVILMDIQPHNQKTRIDFYYAEKDLGIKAVCITEIVQEGRKLYYKKDGRSIPIHRIYNRVIFDELQARKDITVPFDIFGDLDVTWVAHPNWFFKISKYSMPFMDSKYVPKTRFLHEIERYPDDLENYVLKPLFSFAGAGVHIDVTKELLDGIKDPANFILQRKVEYASFLETPDVPARGEIRLLCVWDKTLRPLISLSRLTKGKMIGVDFNKDKTWIGSSTVFFEK